MSTVAKFYDQAETKHLQAIYSKDKKDLSHKELSFIANRVRQNIMDMVYVAKSGHPGGALGLAEIHTALYFSILEEEDSFILSNGHICPVRYSAMAQSGVFPEQELFTFRQLGSRLQGHPSTRYFPEVTNSSGSLGQGLSVACGMALARRLKKEQGFVYVGISDGECQEGMIWEAAMSSAHYQLNNLIVYVDVNGIQIDGHTKDVMSLGNLQEKFSSFGWQVLSGDGNNLKEVVSLFQEAKQRSSNGPVVLLFNTVLGKDVDFMENNPAWHGNAPKEEQHAHAKEQLRSIAKQLMQT